MNEQLEFLKELQDAIEQMDRINEILDNLFNEGYGLGTSL